MKQLVVVEVYFGVVGRLILRATKVNGNCVVLVIGIGVPGKSVCRRLPSCVEIQLRCALLYLCRDLVGDNREAVAIVDLIEKRGTHKCSSQEAATRDERLLYSRTKREPGERVGHDANEHPTAWISKV